MAELIPEEWAECTSSRTIQPPPNASKVDVVALGGGGGGGYNNFGAPGAWLSGTTNDPEAVQVVVGDGGTPGGINNNPPATRGGTSSASGVSATGGAGNSGTRSESTAVPNFTAFGRTFTGGGVALTGVAGRVPGGGGGAGSSAKAGARGQVWLRWWINPKVENLHVGGQTVQQVTVGNTEVQAVYHGDTLIYGTPQ